MSPGLRAQDLSPTQATGHGHTVSLSLGINRLQLQDAHLSDLIYRGSLPTIGLQYRYLGERGYFTGSLRGGRGAFFPVRYPDRSITFITEDVYGNVDSVRVPMRGTSTPVRIELGYLRRLNPGSPVEYAAGAIVSEEAYYQQGFVTPGLLNVASLRPVVETHWRGGGSVLASVSVSIPLVALVSRSNYEMTVSEPGGNKIGGFLSQGTTLTGPGNGHRQVRLSASLGYRIGPRLASVAHYDLGVIKNRHPQPLALREQALSLSLQYSY